MILDHLSWVSGLNHCNLFKWGAATCRLETTVRRQNWTRSLGDGRQMKSRRCFAESGKGINTYVPGLQVQMVWKTYLPNRVWVESQDLWSKNFGPWQYDAPLYFFTSHNFQKFTFQEPMAGSMSYSFGLLMTATSFKSKQGEVILKKNRPGCMWNRYMSISMSQKPGTLLFTPK